MNHRRSHRTAVIIFAVALAAVVILAFATTLHDGDTRVADGVTPPGTVGLAKPHKPPDVAPGQAIPSLPHAPASSR